MTRAGRLGAAIGLLVLLLFAGRWLAGFLADRWWAAELSPAAAAFVMQSHILRVVLKLAGVLVASAWFIGHFLLVYRAVGTVQIRRHVANLEIREALTPATLLTIAVGGGTLLGLLVGGGVSSWWRQVALAWHGVTYGIADPLLDHDLGVYIAQLPLWRSAHTFFFLLTIVALGVVFALYILIGAVRWIEGRPAINDHARRHFGWLLLALGLSLAWGYLLEPYELVAGLAELPVPSDWRVATSVAPVLAGVALSAGALSAMWAVQPRHALAAAGWVVLAAASVIGHWVLPSIVDGGVVASADSLATERLTRTAYGLEPLRVERLRAVGSLAMPEQPALWSASMASRAVDGDSGGLVWADPALIMVQGHERPAWIVLRSTPTASRLAVAAIAADQAAPDGSPLFYRLHDSLPRASPAALLETSDRIFRPDGPRYRLHGDSATGVPVDSWVKRLALTWALQAGALLSGVPANAHIDWYLSPAIRLARVAPFAEWGTPVVRIIDGNLVWLSDGYVTSQTFPLAHRMRWRNRTVGSVRAAFVGVVDAETGATHIYLRPGADRLAEAWASVSQNMVEPASAIPAAMLRVLPYPAELFRVQVQELERSPWRAGTLMGRLAPGSPSGELPPTETQWSADTSGPIHVAVYDQPAGRNVAALLLGGREQGRDVLRLLRLDSTATIPSRGVLESRWNRFPSYDLFNDSVQDEGGRLERGPIHYDPVPGGVVAYQVHFARRASTRPAIVWVSVAAPPDRLGAGRSLKQGWSNLLGATVPEPVGGRERDRIAKARGWLLQADSAIRLGDWAAFGRAWRELREALGVAGDSVTR